MIQSRSLAFCAIAVVLAAAPAFAAGPAANTPVTITGFSRATLSVYDKQGNPLPTAPASAFKLPITSTDAGVGGAVGLPYQGKTVYVRRLDLILGSPPPCAQLAQKAPRGAGSLKAGERLGAGASTDCLVGGK